MRKNQLYTVLFLVIMGCQNKDVMKDCDFDNYTMAISNKWKKVDINGIDSNVYVIITNSGDSIFSDYGKYSSSFKDTKVIFSKEQILKYKSLGMDTQELIGSSIPEIDQSQGTFLKEYYFYDTINNTKAKIKVPKLFGNGEIGIHFDSLENSNKLTIKGVNLNEEEQKTLLESFKTIKFK